MSFSDPNINNNKEQEGEASYNFVNRKQSEGFGLVQLLLIIITTFVIIVALGLFGYSFYLRSEIEKKTVVLTNSEATLKNLNLEEIKSLSSRLALANNLIDKHENIGSLFKKLEGMTEDKLNYNSLNLSFNETKKNYNLSLQGDANSYETLIRQIDVFKLAKNQDYFSNVEVKSISNKTNSIDFGLAIDVDVAGKDKMKDNPLFNFTDLGGNTSVSTTASIITPPVATSTVDVNILNNKNIKVEIMNPNKKGI